MKRMLNNGRRYVRTHWQLIIACMAGSIVLGLMLLFRLGSIVGGLSDAEVRQAMFASSWRSIADNPLGLPLSGLQWAIQTLIPHHGNTVRRAASPILGVLALASFAYVLRRWYGIRSAVYGTVLFGMSGWFLHVSRYAGTEILYLWAVPTLLALCIAWDRYKQTPWVSTLVLAGLGLGLYIPGLVWFVVLALALQPHLLKRSWQGSKTWYAKVLLVLVPIVVITPLALALVRDTALIRPWLGLPDQFAAITNMARNLLHSVSFFVYRGPATPELWLARTPILNFFAMVMALLGVLFYARHIWAPRTRLLTGFFLVGTGLFALGGPVSISILVPIVYLFVAAGFGYLLHEWLRVFPRNPLARGIGFGLLAIVIALACLHDLRSYYVAWPNASATKAQFHNHP